VLITHLLPKDRPDLLQRLLKAMDEGRSRHWERMKHMHWSCGGNVLIESESPSSLLGHRHTHSAGRSGMYFNSHWNATSAKLLSLRLCS
jgi:hypothetical protein